VFGQEVRLPQGHRRKGLGAGLVQAGELFMSLGQPKLEERVVGLEQVEVKDVSRREGSCKRNTCLSSEVEEEASLIAPFLCLRPQLLWVQGR